MDCIKDRIKINDIDRPLSKIHLEIYKVYSYTCLLADSHKYTTMFDLIAPEPEEIESLSKYYCSSPKIFYSGFKVPCGKCSNYRKMQAFSKSKEWRLRLRLEAEGYTKSVHVILTYRRNDYCHYSYEAMRKVFKKDFDKFMKRLRKHCTVRYFCVGDYERGKRYHLHCILFGLSTTYDKKIKRCWKKGNVCCKKLGNPNSYESLEFLNKIDYVYKKIYNNHKNYLFQCQSQGLGKPYLSEENKKHHRETNQRYISRPEKGKSKGISLIDYEYKYSIPRYFRERIWPKDTIYASRFIIDQRFPEKRAREFIINENYPELRASDFFYTDNKPYEIE